MRQFSLAHPGIVVGMWVVLMIAFIYPNYKVGELRGGPIDDALYAGDPYRVRHELVALQETFNAREIFPVIKLLDAGVTADALREVLELTRALESIPGFAVMSPATLLEYRDDGEGISGTPYITEEELKNFDAEAWKERVKKDGSVWGLLVGKNFDWISLAVIPPTDDDNATSWEIARVLESRDVTWADKILLKRDMYPMDPSLRGIGLGFGRWTIDRALNFDLLVLPSIGVLISFFVLRWYLVSWMQAGLITVVIIVSSIWFTRGCIWFLHGILPETYERVYTLLAYANCIVQGGSFGLHKMVAYREEGGLSSEEKFASSRWAIDRVIVCIAIMAIGPFLVSMRTLGVWQMVELGIIASVGVAIIAFFLAMVVLPASYLLSEKMRIRLTGHTEPVQARVWVERYYAPWLTHFQLPPAAAVTLVVLLFLHVSYLYITGAIASKTRPLDYITDTWVERSARELERRGAGNDTMGLFAWPRDPLTGLRIPVANTDYPIRFFEGLWQFQNDLRPGGAFEIWQQQRYGSIYPIIWAGSILDSVAMISQASFTDTENNKKPFPTNNQEVSDAILITTDLQDGIEQWVRSSQGIRITVFTVIDDSVQFRELLERIDAYAKEKFPLMELTSFGKSIYFPRADQLITNGQGWNVLSSLGMLVVCYALLVGWIQNGKNQPYTLHLGSCGLVLALPFLFAVALNGERMWLFNIPLSMSSAPISELTINATGDFGMILVAAYVSNLKKRMEPQHAMYRALVVSGAVVLVDCLLNCIAFSPLWVSRFMPVREVAGTMQLMLIASAIGVIVLMPSLLILITKRKEAAYGTLQNDSVIRGDIRRVAVRSGW